MSQRSRLCTVLVDEHAYGDATHVETVKEVLYLILNVQLFTRLLRCLLHLQDALCHRLHDVHVPIAYTE